MTYLDKFKFTCNECKEPFVIWHIHLSTKENIVCPNCSYSFPSELTESLKSTCKAVNGTYKLLKDADMVDSLELIFKAH